MIISNKQGVKLLVIFLVCAIGMIITGCSSGDAITTTPRSDLVTISTIETFGELDRAPVQFKHDKHTGVLRESGDDCQSCHLTEESGKLSQKFKRLTDDDPTALMDLYHDGCISCHLQRGGTAPVTCGGCHKLTTAHISSWMPIGFDRSLHYRHAEASQQKCDGCHHSYDEVGQKLVYVKGEEASCRDCHHKEPDGKVLSLRMAAHYQCIECHKTTENAGPTDCAGCHDAQKQAEIEIVEKPGRLFRNQPDFTLLSASATDIKNSRMKTVPFPHLEHENVLPTCRACHHETLQACNKCHTLDGEESGGNVTLERAMHDMNSQHSCVGCHEIEKSAAECAGCHTLMEQGRISENSCVTCHTGPEPDRVENERSRYRNLDSFRPVKSDTRFTFKDSDIPDTVLIGTLSDKYQQVVFPHRMVIDSLRNIIKDNSVATYFHDQEDVICQGCHHHTPIGSKPPLCESCHGQPFNETELFKPGLQGAFHQQCLGCHQKMNIEKPSDCVGCHAQK